MREEIKDPLRLKHMLEAIKNVQTFMNGKVLQDLKTDNLLFYAVVKNIEIIGEAAYKITKTLKETHPEIPWEVIEGMRHVLVHEYYHIRPSELFEVYKKDIPELMPKIEILVSLYPIPKPDK